MGGAKGEQLGRFQPCKHPARYKTTCIVVSVYFVPRSCMYIHR